MKKFALIGYLLMGSLLISPVGLAFQKDIFDEPAGDLADDLVDGGVGIDMKGMSDGSFTENKGQWDPDILFVGRTEFGQIGFGRGFIHYNLISAEENRINVDPFSLIYEAPECSIHGLRIDLLDSRDIMPIGIGPMEQKTNYFVGNDPSKWVTGARSYRGVLYQDIWSGIDLKYYFNEEGVKYDMILDPGSEPDDIRLRIEGHGSMEITEEGLSVKVSDGMSIQDTNLFVYDEGNRKIDSKFHIIDESTYSFELGEYDRSSRVTIDPLVYSSFVGGNGADVPKWIELDQDGNIVVCGTTPSTDFPTSIGAISYSNSGESDMCVFKMKHDGSTILFSTYIGGNGNDWGTALKIGPDSDIFLTGGTESTNFPTTTGAYKETAPGGRDCVALRLDPSGSLLDFSSYIGGSGSEIFSGLDIDVQGNMYMGGWTTSSDFPTTEGSFDGTFNGGGDDIIITKMDPTGSILVYSTYVGGAGAERAHSVAIDRSGNLYATGYTESPDFPTTNGAYSRSRQGPSDGYILKLDPSGSSLEYSTYVGGADSGPWDDFFTRIKVDPDGNAYTTGYTCASDFPTTSGAFDTSFNGGSNDIFVLKMNSNGTGLVYSTYLGGDSEEVCHDLRLDQDNNVYVLGETSSTDLPVTSQAVCSSYQGGQSDGVLAVISESGDSLEYSTFIGGTDDDNGHYLTLDGNNTCYLTVHTLSTDFPVTPNAFDQSHNGNSDIAVLKIDTPLTKLRPEPPMNLQARLGVGYVQLDWEAPIDTGSSEINGYKIFRGDSIDSITLFNSSGHSTDFNDTTIENGAVYFYYITALNDDRESFPSDIIRVKDVEPPRFVKDLTPGIGRTGDNFIFEVEVRDNVGMRNVNLIYQFGTGYPTNVTMEGDGFYWYNITIPYSMIEDLKYFFYAEDVSGLTDQNTEKSVVILDNDSPILKDVDFPDLAYTGNVISVSADVHDNIDVEHVFIEYWFGSAEGSNLSIPSSDHHYSLKIPIPFDSLDPLHMVIIAFDTSGNFETTGTLDVEIKDNIPPSVLIIDVPRIAYAGEKLPVLINVSDNIGIEWVYLEYWYNTGDHNNISISSASQVYSYELIVSENSEGPIRLFISISDASGNWVQSDTLNVDIQDDENPESEADNDTTLLWVIIILLIIIVCGLIAFIILRSKREVSVEEAPGIDEQPGMAPEAPMEPSEESMTGEDMGPEIPDEEELF